MLLREQLVRTSARENILQPLRDMANLWSRVASADTVLELADSYDIFLTTPRIISRSSPTNTAYLA